MPAGFGKDEAMKHVSEWGISLDRVWLAIIPALVALALALTGCSDGQKASIRFKVLATISYQGKRMTASTVMECSYWRVEHSLTGMGGGTNLLGEALIFNVNDREAFYILPSWRDPTGYINRYWERAILKSIGVGNPIGQLSDTDFETMKAAKGIYAVDFFGHDPLFVRFGDEADPKSIEQLDPHKLSKAWPGMRFDKLEIEITDESVTELLRQRLPWLNQERAERIFNNYPPGTIKPANESPLSYIINTSAFLGSGSWR